MRYDCVAVDFLPPAVLGASLQRLSALLAAGRLAPLPRVTFSFDAAAAALRQLAQAQHVGKVVVRLPPAAGPTVATSGSWAITGGLGALGSLAAGWLASHGHRYLVLLGRSGRYGGGASAACCEKTWCWACLQCTRHAHIITASCLPQVHC